jgi:hypothetical protein
MIETPRFNSWQVALAPAVFGHFGKFFDASEEHFARVHKNRRPAHSARPSISVRLRGRSRSSTRAGFPAHAFRFVLLTSDHSDPAANFSLKSVMPLERQSETERTRVHRFRALFTRLIPAPCAASMMPVGGRSGAC